MPAWEHRLAFASRRSQLEEQMNTLGRDGWQAAGAFVDPDLGMVVVMKRETS